jgi:hypothetical protein
MMRLTLIFTTLLAVAPSLGWSQTERTGLQSSPSSWVRAQTTSPVRWLPWTEAALELARSSRRPIYVLVGSELNEFTRATLRETFSRPETAAWMNEQFVCLLVDTEAQPELAAYAQHFIQSARQLRGWPVHLWLTPDLQVYEGSNYLPPSEEWGKPGFLKTARQALESWTQNPERARTMAAEAKAMLTLPPLDPAATPVPTLLARSTEAWISAIDPVNGGFGSAPKLPEPEVIQFLLRGDPVARAAGVDAALAVVRKGARDARSGGFFRRTLDAEWTEPYRQMTLLDQARIALALLEANRSTPTPALRDAAGAALDFAWRDLRRPDGTLATALDGTATLDAGHSHPLVPSGAASIAAHAWFLCALTEAQSSGATHVGPLIAALRELLLTQIRPNEAWLPHQPGSPVEGTATDYLALAYALRRTGSSQPSDLPNRLIHRACTRFFDSSQGCFVASPPHPSAGIDVRVPLGGGSPTAERLAILLGVDRTLTAAVARSLAAAIEHDPQPSGEALLTLWSLSHPSPEGG